VLVTSADLAASTRRGQSRTRRYSCPPCNDGCIDGCPYTPSNERPIRPVQEPQPVPATTTPGTHLMPAFPCLAGAVAMQPLSHWLCTFPLPLTRCSSALLEA
jgi:hypothetical protein